MPLKSLSYAGPAAVFLLCAVGAMAQDLGEIRGKVADAKGVAIPAATVRLFSGAPGPPMETLTREDGSFEFIDLPAGSYRISVEMSGFASLTKEGIDPSIPAGRQLALTLHSPQRAAAAAPRPPMQRNAPGGPPQNSRFQQVEMAGDISESAPVAPASEGSTSMREDNSDLLVISGAAAASFGAIDWNDAGMRDRMADMIQRMGVGGFAISAFPDRELPPGGEQGAGGFGMPGQRPGGGGFGGGPMGGGPMGGGPGGGRGGMVFGGGRGMLQRQQKINGTVFSNYTNSFLNARPYSITGKELSKPVQIQNSFGGSIGGQLPWQPRTPQVQARGGRRGPMQSGMWFFTYQGARNRNPYDSLTTVPTPLERSGDFSQTQMRSGPLAGRPIRLADPIGPPGALFPDGRIPASRIDPAAAALLSYIPMPNLAGSVQNFTMQRGLINTSDSFSIRLNTPITARLNAGVNYSHRRSDSISSQQFPGLDTDRTTRGNNLGLNAMFRYRPRFTMNFRASWNRNTTLAANPFAFEKDVAGELGITGVSREPINFGPPTINFTNYGDLRVSNPSRTVSQTINAGGGVNRMGTRHTISGGGDISLVQRNTFGDPNGRGTFDFTGLATSLFDSNGRPIAGTGYDLADFLLGYAASTSRRYGSSNNYLRNRSLNLFVQDNWRARPNLTLSIGLRYEFILPFYEKYNRIVSLDIAPGFAAVSPAFPGGTGSYGTDYPRSLVFADRNNLGPRFGVAWKRKANSKWTLRAGWGMFYNPGAYPYVVGQLVGQPPFAVNQNLLTSPEFPLTLEHGFPTLPDVTVLNSYAIDPHYRLGYVQQWNLSYQTQLFRLYTLELGYNGSKGTRLDVLRAPNRAPSGSSAGSVEDNRPISNAGNFVYQESSAGSILHAFRVNATRRFSRGFRMDGSYTFSKSIDNASGVGGGSLVVVQDERNLAAERSLSSFDQRHRFQMNFNMDLPFGQQRMFLANAPPLVQTLVAGWNINGSLRMNSGTPLTPRLLGNVANNSGTGSNYSERPDATGIDPSLPGAERTTARFFNTEAFAIPAPGRFGNAARYSIAGPGTVQLDASLRKSFRLGESATRRADFSWQVTNALNHPNWGGVSTVVNSLNYGRVTGARGMRQMQFTLRINF